MPKHVQAGAGADFYHGQRPTSGLPRDMRERWQEAAAAPHFVGLDQAARDQFQKIVPVLQTKSAKARIGVC